MQLTGWNGDQQNVTKYGEALVKADSLPYTANTRGLEFSVYMTATPGGAGNTFAYLGNTSTSTYVVDAIELNCAAAEIFNISVHKTGVTGGAAATAIASMTPGYSTVSTPFSAQYNAALTITDPSPVIVGVPAVSAAKQSILWNPTSCVRLLPGMAISVKAVTGGNLIQTVVRGFVEA